MNAIEKLQKNWQDSVRFRGLHASMSLEKEGLIIGAKTVLAKRNDDGGLAIDGEEARLLTLLAVAYGQPVKLSVLGAIRRASKHMHAGNDVMAAMHIALALPKLADSFGAARRVFVADGLMAQGVSPRDIWSALGLDSAPLDELEKFDPNEPRVPAGSGRTSGQWTSAGTIATAEAALPGIGRAQPAIDEAVRAMQAMSAHALERLPQVLAETAEYGARIASHAALPLAVATELLDSPETGGIRLDGTIRDFPDLRYSRHASEVALRITRASDGRAVLTLYPTSHGAFVDPEKGIVAHMEDDELVIGPPPIPLPPPGAPLLSSSQAVPSARSKASVQARARERTKEPDQCPKTTNDWDGRIGPVGKKDKDYEDYIKRLVNPDKPTPRGMGYKFPNPSRPRYPVIYDDCQHETGALIEAKGTGYAAMLAKRGDFMKNILAEKWVDQATNQVAASQERPMQWYFAEKEAAAYARKLFEAHKNLEHIQVFYQYWREDRS